MNQLPIDQTELDRLVDDELDEASRRALLFRIEQAGVWRQLAITFLESQAVQSGLRDLCSAQSTTAEPPHAAHRVPIKESFTNNYGRALLGVGVSRPRHVRGFITTVVVLIAAVALGVWVVHATHSRFMDNELHPIAANSRNNIDITADPATSQDAALMESEGELPTSVQLVVNDGRSDVPRVLELPIESPPNATSFATWEPRSALPEDVVLWLNASGHEVEEASSLMPVTLPNGRRVVFPVNQVRVNYRGPKWHQ